MALSEGHQVWLHVWEIGQPDSQDGGGLGGIDVW